MGSTSIGAMASMGYTSLKFLGLVDMGHNFLVNLDPGPPKTEVLRSTVEELLGSLVFRIGPRPKLQVDPQR